MMRENYKYGDISSTSGKRIFSFISIIIILIVWIILCELKIVPELFWPAPSSVVKQFVQLTVQGYKGHTLFGHIGISLYRVMAGFLSGSVLGIFVGMSMGINKKVRAMLDPVIELYRPVPPLAYIPIIIIWLGITDVSKITLLFLASFAVIVINTRAGVQSVPLEKLRAAYSLGARPKQVLRFVILPNAMPGIVTGMRVAMGVCWGTLVAAEMVAANSGIGWMVLNASRYLRTDIVIVGIIVMGALGYGLDVFLRYIEKKVFPWRGY